MQQRPRPPGELHRPPESFLAARPALRRRLGRVRRTATEALQRLDPSRVVLPRRLPAGSVAVVGVYRRRNAEHVRAALAPLVAGAEVRLWALDEVAPVLAHVTAGVGPGARFALLNRLVCSLVQRPTALVLLDDDVRFVVGDLNSLVAVGERAGLALWQPAHSATSHASFGFVRRRWGCVLRRTSFVEQGPVVVLSPAAQAVLLPLPEDLGMGWGVEARWEAGLRAAGLSLGIVDAVALRHLVPGGSGYDRDAAEAVLRVELAASGLEALDDLQRTLQSLGPLRALAGLRPR